MKSLEDMQWVMELLGLEFGREILFIYVCCVCVCLGVIYVKLMVESKSKCVSRDFQIEFWGFMFRKVGKEGEL